MNPTLLRLLLPLLLLVPALSGAAVDNPRKAAVVAAVDAHRDELTALSDEIWRHAEIAFRETQSADALVAHAEENGFRVSRGTGEIPTAFVAEYGSGKPVIGIMGEFDALPGLSQDTVPTRSPLAQGEPGHGCGHNVFGAASLGAAIAIKEQIEAGELSGTIRYYGTPAEEKFFGKLWMIRAGAFDDVDVMMDWHPADKLEASVQSSQALVDFLVEFDGQSAHAAADPWNGRSAGDALELYAHGINAYREHIRPTVRIHYHIMDAGKVVNVVPDYAKIWVRVRDRSREGMTPVYERVQAMAEGAAILANVEHKVSLISGVHELLPNRTGGAALQANLEALGSISYSEEELAFARTLQASTGKPQVGMDAEVNPLRETEEDPPGGSTDVGDVSYVVPTISLAAPIAPSGVPWHSWAVVASGGMSLGHKGLVHAAKALAMTMVDLFEDPRLVEQIKTEFAERKGDYTYQGILPPGPPPLDFEQ
ncbi:amidohydrolase [Chromatocurvus halotolerans]|uniref:Aminobenzoyl-glutamate utilization protein B n=1 Tax=Chromatocurvus halotolerans TaxID=1132028 RepID=A0A4R2KTJ4_9GAMM|nr:amidohydrolase [Chromatocurvus halotolerans]TCO76097.1 aminobenzoyl-glutamate utilization protein B [Chromatocurvus halotolerans]